MQNLQENNESNNVVDIKYTSLRQCLPSVLNTFVLMACTHEEHSVRDLPTKAMDEYQ